MSFYGSRYEEVAKTFATFFIKNSGKEKTSILTSPGSAQIDSDGKQGEMTFDSGNQWIALSGRMNPDNRCFIYHNGPNKNSDKSKLVMSATSEILEGEETVNKEVVDEDGNVILDLTKNNELKIQAIGYDETGHIYFDSNNTKIFKIPKVEVAKTLEELTRRVTEAEEDIINLTEQDVETLTSIENLVSDVSGLTTSVLSLNNLVGSRNNMSNLSGVSITGTIGNISALNGSTIVETVTSCKKGVEDFCG